MTPASYAVIIINNNPTHGFIYLKGQISDNVCRVHIRVAVSPKRFGILMR
jgi:hypothetical protein